MKQNDIIYQIFPRNYCKEKPFIKIKEDLPRIKALGVDIIYLLPIHEIGIKERKGTYGSPYAIKDYFSISKDLGTLEEFKELITAVHEAGMKIIIDMVFNHTSPDNVLLKDHEDYYFHKDGKLGNRVGDWSDIVDLDTNKKETQDYLVSVLKYWSSVGVDGFRFDVCSMINFAVFQKGREELKEAIFVGESIDLEFREHLISQGDNPTADDDLYQVFDSLYNYNYYMYLNRYICKGGKLDIVVDRLNADKKNLRLLCLENHDIPRIMSLVNKDTLDKLLDFYSFIKGQLFIYAGQEYGNMHLPELFEKDVVDFTYVDKDVQKLYTKYINIKKNQKEIVDSSYELVGKDSIKVLNKYIDGTSEEKTFTFK